MIARTTGLFSRPGRGQAVRKSLTNEKGHRRPDRRRLDLLAGTVAVRLNRIGSSTATAKKLAHCHPRAEAGWLGKSGASSSGGRVHRETMDKGQHTHAATFERRLHRNGSVGHPDEYPAVERGYSLEPATLAGCAGVCTPCAPPGVHTKGGENSRESLLDRRISFNMPTCAGCAPPKRYYRVTGVCARVHARREECSALTLHTLHTTSSKAQFRCVRCSPAGITPQKRAPPRVHTEPPGGAHLNNLNSSRGGCCA